MTVAGDVEKAKAFLQKSENGQDSLYDHLCKVLLRILSEAPDKALERIEAFSLAVKSGEVDQQTLHYPRVVPKDETKKAEMAAWLDKVLHLCGYRKPVPPKLDENGEPIEEEPVEEPVPDVTRVADVYSPFSILNQVGVGLGDRETYLLQLACKRLALQTNAEAGGSLPAFENPRFFGKVLGLDRDYWVVESKPLEPAELPEDAAPTVEGQGTGSNEFIYFACNDLIDGDWVLLPDLTPEIVKASRSVRRLLTGDLDAPVTGRNRFQWTEAYLLRSHIGRIASACVVGPAGSMQRPEDADEENPTAIEPVEDFAGTEEHPSGADKWVHLRGHLRIQGRVKKYQRPEPEDEDAPPIEPTEEELEEMVNILRPLADDKSSLLPEDEETSNVWKIVAAFDSTTPLQVFYARNRAWPGATAAYVHGTKDRLANVYIGYGLKYTGKREEVTPLSQVQPEFNENTVENEVDDAENEGEKKTVMSTQFVEAEDVMPPPPEAAAEEEPAAE